MLQPPRPKETIQSFLDECAVLDSAAETPSKVLYDAYAAFCNDRCWVVESLSSFGRYLRGHPRLATGFSKRVNGVSKRIVRGARLKGEEHGSLG